MKDIKKKTIWNAKNAKKQNQLLAGDPLSSTIHNNFKESLSVFHMINDQQDFVSVRRFNVFSAGFPQALQLWSYFRSTCDQNLKPFNRSWGRKLWLSKLTKLAFTLECDCMWVCDCLPATHSQWLTQRASACTKLHPTGGVTKSPREPAPIHPHYSLLNAAMHIICRLSAKVQTH